MFNLKTVEEPKTEKCRFPSWVQTHPQWFKLDQSSIFQFDGEQFKVTNYDTEQFLTANGVDNLEMSGSCMQLLDHETGHSAKLIVHARADW